MAAKEPEEPAVAIKIEQAQVRAATAAAFGFADTGPFKARFAFYQRSGVVTEKPGTGQRLHYDHHQQERLLACFELSELGLPPALVLRLMANWQPLGEAYRAAQGSIVPFPDAGPNDVILVVRGCRFASGAWDAAGEAHQPMVTWCLLGDLKKTYAVEWLCKTPAAIPANLLASNLSARLRRYHEALVVVTKGGSEGMFVDELDAVPAARSAKKRKAKSTRKRRA